MLKARMQLKPNSFEARVSFYQSRKSVTRAIRDKGVKMDVVLKLAWVPGDKFC